MNTLNFVTSFKTKWKFKCYTYWVLSEHFVLSAKRNMEGSPSVKYNPITLDYGAKHKVM